MKRANILRAIAVVAVLTFAMLTTGCLKAEVTVTFSEDELTVSENTPIRGTFRFVLTGYLAVGMYSELKVEWLDENDDVIPMGEGEQDQFEIAAWLAPIGDTRTFELDLEERPYEIKPPAAAWGPDGPEIKQVVFTFKATGLGLPTKVVEVPVSQGSPSA